MTIKLCLLKSGEDIITDLTEMRTSEGPEGRVIGYFFDKPCIVKMLSPEPLEGKDNKAGFKVSLFPWMPLTPETKIPITADWLITMVEPAANLKQMYIEDVVNGSDSKSNPSDDKSNSDN